MMTLKKQVEVVEQISASDLGAMFAYSEASEQAAFLEYVAEAFKEFGGNRDEVQMAAIVEELNEDGRQFLVDIARFIAVGEIVPLEVGKWVQFDGERGRIKSWNDKWVFVVFHCDDNWQDFENYTGAACKRSDLRPT
jgi:hypothetical protein